MHGIRFDPPCIVFPNTYISSTNRITIKALNESDKVHHISFRNKETIQEEIDILNVKCEPEMIGSLRLMKGFLPAYHMNKEHWNTIIISEKVDKSLIYELIEQSYKLTMK